MGCQAITPHLVGLARRLEEKPFHLLATHCQRNPKDEVVGYIKSKGLAADTPNMTVTSFGGHPGVKGNGHVPYYLVFDHKGKLAHHHMCGDYHGGDGLKMIEWVDELLAKTPAIYLGDEPFETETELAKQVAKKKNLKGALAAIDRKLAAEDTSEASKADLERLRNGIVDYRDRMIESATTRMASKPSETVPALKDLAKELKGTSIGGPVDEKIKELSTSKELKDAIAIEKGLAKIVRSLERRKPCKACKRKGLDGLNAECAACREASMGAITKASRKLERLTEGHEDLPIAETVKRYAATWR